MQTLLLPLLLVTLLLNSCAWRQATPRDIAANSLKSIAVTVDKAMEAYSEVYVQGHVDQNTHTKVGFAHVKYTIALATATTALETDYKAADMAELNRLAGELINLILEIL